MAKIIVNVPRDPNKGTTVTVEGHAGPGCQKMTEGIERALGKTVKDDTTEEFNQPGVQGQQQFQ